MANPLMIGTNDKLTYNPVFSPVHTEVYYSPRYLIIILDPLPINIAVMMTVNMGAELLIVSIKLTAT